MIRILCLDIEGGHGGSSRSMYQSLRYLERSPVQVALIKQMVSALKGELLPHLLPHPKTRHAARFKNA
jgi:hypothetical protein